MTGGAGITGGGMNVGTEENAMPQNASMPAVMINDMYPRTNPATAMPSPVTRP